MIPSAVLLPGEERIPLRNLFVVGQNYAAAISAGKSPPSDPVITLKPTSALAFNGDAIVLPSFSDDVRFEIELTLLIGRRAKNVSGEEALAAIAGYGVGLDLTAFDVQQRAKKLGLPWTLSKGFETAACLSPFFSAANLNDPLQLPFRLDVNGETRQSGTAKEMLFSIEEIVRYLSRAFSLSRGDVIYTGTPAGASTLRAGDELVLFLEGAERARFTVAT